MADADRFIEVVGDEEGSLVHLGRQRHELALEFPANQGIERRERLVHQENVRIGRQRPGKSDTLLHAARKLVGIVVAPTSEFDPFECGLGGCVTRVPVDPAQLETERDIVQHRPVGQEGHILEHHADCPRPEFAQGVRRKSVDRDTLDQDFARTGIDEPVHVTYECGLAGARQAHDAEDLALGHVEADVPHADDASEFLQNLAFSDSA